jgi:hypothetical protein
VALWLQVVRVRVRDDDLEHVGRSWDQLQSCPDVVDAVLHESPQEGLHFLRERNDRADAGDLVGEGHRAARAVVHEGRDHRKELFDRLGLLSHTTPQVSWPPPAQVKCRFNDGGLYHKKGVLSTLGGYYVKKKNRQPRCGCRRWWRSGSGASWRCQATHGTKSMWTSV